MRTTFVKTLIELAEKDEKVFLLTGDLGTGFFEEFANKFKDRFLNCGIAEQNMAGIAAGLALAGKKPYIYSIVPFTAMRCFEQIKNDICYQNLNVKIIGMGGGFNYGPLGSTHHAIEDLAILRSLPNMTVIIPADMDETRELLFQAYQKQGPAYFRLSKVSGNENQSRKNKIELGGISIFGDGKDGAIITNGVQVGYCVRVCERLKELGYNLKVLGLHTLKPIDADFLLRELEGIKTIITVEEHNLIGGMGDAVSAILLESGWSGSFKKLGVPDQYPSEAGSADYLRKKYLLDREGILKSILDFIKL